MPGDSDRAGTLMKNVSQCQRRGTVRGTVRETERSRRGPSGEILLSVVQREHDYSTTAACEAEQP
jgi:hypothetical protein